MQPVGFARRKWLLSFFIALPLLLAAAMIAWRARLPTAFAFDPGRSVGELLGRNGRLLVFRSRERGRNDKRIAVLPREEPGGERVFVGPRCERVAASASRIVCLSRTGDLLRPYQLALFDAGMRELGHAPLDGLPSRARVSPDEKYFATTSFVTGDSYSSEFFSTRTFLHHLRAGETGLGKAENVEDYELVLNEEVYRFPDKNVWGVTFVPGQDRFFATVSLSGHRYLVDGSIPSRRMVALRDNVECPSLSPDGLKLAYKRRVRDGQTVAWRFHILDLVSGIDTELGEERSVDDQIAWLDDTNVVYGLARNDRKDETDIWIAPVDGKRPSLFIRDADSPTVIARTSSGR